MAMPRRWRAGMRGERVWAEKGGTWLEVNDTVVLVRELDDRLVGKVLDGAVARGDGVSGGHEAAGGGARLRLEDEEDIGACAGHEEDGRSPQGGLVEWCRQGVRGGANGVL